MEIESRESIIAAVLAHLRAQGVGEDWIEKIVSEANRMMDNDPVVLHVRDQATLALAAMRKHKAAKPPTDNIAESINLLEARLWTGRILENFRVMLRPGERLEQVEYFALVTNQRRLSRDEIKRGGRFVTETNDGFYANQFASDAQIRDIQAAAEMVNRQEAAPRYGRNLDFPNGGRP